MTTGDDQFFEAWQQQADAGMKIIGAMAEASAKLNKAQLACWGSVFEAMTEANGRILQYVQQCAPAGMRESSAQDAKSSGALTVPGDLALRLWSDMYRQVDSFTRNIASAAGQSIGGAAARAEPQKQQQATD